MIYILFPNDNESDCVYENRQLGEFSYPKIQLKQRGLFSRKSVFYAKQGFKILTKMITNEDKMLNQITIKTSSGKILTIEKFLDSLNDTEIRYEN